MARSATEEAQRREEELLVIDCDIHQDWTTDEEFVQYLPEHYQDRGLTTPGGRGWTSPLGEFGHLRDDAAPEHGPPGSDYDLLAEQLFGDFGVDYGILTGPGAGRSLMLHPNVHYAKAAIRAYNEWQIHEWLDRDDRLLGSIHVVPHAPEHAIEEINRLASHPRMVQVMMPVVHEAPLGRPTYWDIYEAAVENDLPVAMHGGPAGSGVATAPRTAAGVSGSYFEKHILGSAVHMGQLTSLIVNGVFVEYPDLDWVFIEQRLGWIPHVMWHMDKCWKGLKEAYPWLDRPPSDYIRENVWFTTQPIEEPEKREHLFQLFDMLHADETLMFSSDYPHWDNDDPNHILRDLDHETKERIFYKNAVDVYNLESIIA